MVDYNIALCSSIIVVRHCVCQWAPRCGSACPSGWGVVRRAACHHHRHRLVAGESGAVRQSWVAAGHNPEMGLALHRIRLADRSWQAVRQKAGPVAALAAALEEERYPLAAQHLAVAKTRHIGLVGRLSLSRALDDEVDPEGQSR